MNLQGEMDDGRCGQCCTELCYLGLSSKTLDHPPFPVPPLLRTHHMTA